jgi:hypothetical protein
MVANSMRERQASNVLFVSTTGLAVKQTLVVMETARIQFALMETAWIQMEMLPKVRLEWHVLLA